MSGVAMGNFDGVHIAHKKVLEAVCGCGEKAVCLTFEEHPLSLISGKAPKRLLTGAETERKIKEAGIDEIVYLDFARVKDYSPEEFFRKILIEKLDAKVVSCGYNYTFGKNKAGTVETLKKLCEKYGVELRVIDKIIFEGDAVSSSRIRRAVEAGEIEKANEMLGYSFHYSGKVVHGKHMGRELGFPTANIYLNELLAVPKFGVYAATVIIDGEEYKSVTNIGLSPTLGGEGWRSESFIFDFNEDIYGKEITVFLEKFLRAEQKFGNKEELISAVEKNKAEAKNYFWG